MKCTYKTRPGVGHFSSTSTRETQSLAIPLVKFYAKAQGTYLVWVDVSGVVKKIGAKAKAEAESKAGRSVTPQQIVERWFTKNAGVALNAGSSYGLGGANHMRMNIATSRKTLQLALDSLARATKTT